MFDITPKKFKKLVAPRKGFTEKTKARFLAVFDAAYPASVHAGRPRGFVFIIRGLAVCGALVAVLAGVSVYADTANVSATSALYPFKRLSENVQLTFTPPEEKADLQATFAARRATEIHEVSLKEPSSTLITRLSSDLNAEVEDSVGVAWQTDLTDGNLDDVCGKIFSAIATSSLAMHGELSIGSRAFLRFEKVCVQKEIANGDNGKNDGANAPAAVSAPRISAAASEQSVETGSQKNIESPTSTELQIRGGGSFNVIFGRDGSHKLDHRAQDDSAAANSDNDESQNDSRVSADGTVTASTTTIFVPDVKSYLDLRAD